jgi:DnaJ-domain-containing protein 1
MDYFATLGVPRHAWLDPEMLKERFLQASSTVHPDKVASSMEKLGAEKEFAELNAAYKTLCIPRTRILYLLELAGFPKGEHVQAVPETALRLFPLVAETTQNADELLKQKNSASSPMLKVEFFSRAVSQADVIQGVQSQLRDKVQEIESILRAEAPLEERRISPERASKLQETAATLGFLERWQAQLQERVMALTF